MITMLQGIRSFFGKEMSLSPVQGTESGRAVGGAPDRATRRLHLAACALFLELVYADDEFTEAERGHMEGALQRHFELDEATARELVELAEAERASAIDLYQFATLIRSSYDLGQRTVLAEVMWGLILADGEIAQREAYLLRKIGNLLGLKPGYLAAARRRIEPEP
ncbi:MAG: TerB family tellurite resistance protein [Gemmatimonadetes bacterium]|nr:TerB family tellurite resistance protein [Gemmatimonadota bacterium]